MNIQSPYLLMSFVTVLVVPACAPGVGASTFGTMSTLAPGRAHAMSAPNLYAKTPSSDVEPADEGSSLVRAVFRGHKADIGQYPPVVRLYADDMTELGVSHGDRVRVSSELGVSQVFVVCTYQKDDTIRRTGVFMTRSGRQELDVEIGDAVRIARAQGRGSCP